jgi:hypothetical protein
MILRWDLYDSRKRVGQGRAGVEAFFRNCRGGCGVSCIGRDKNRPYQNVGSGDAVATQVSISRCNRVRRAWRSVDGAGEGLIVVELGRTAGNGTTTTLLIVAPTNDVARKTRRCKARSQELSSAEALVVPENGDLETVASTDTCAVDRRNRVVKRDVSSLGKPGEAVLSCQDRGSSRDSKAIWSWGESIVSSEISGGDGVAAQGNESFIG